MKKRVIEQIKRKQTLNSKKTSSRSFIGTSRKQQKKKISGKATVHNDHYLINMGGQRPKIGSNWPLTGHYLQRCS